MFSDTFDDCAAPPVSTRSEGFIELLAYHYYEDVRRIAAYHMRKSCAFDETLTPTALVHELFLKLSQSQGRPDFKSRHEFLSFAAKTMRSILVDRARARQAQKRCGNPVDVELENLSEPERANESLLALDVALKRLAQFDPFLSQIVHLRYFAGLSVPEVASLLGVSESTVKREWKSAKSWLSRELTRP